jgi:DNA-directed RNA polymerase specialized sigma24 family protein
MSEWTTQLIAERFVQSAVTLKRLPNDRSLGYRHSWPAIVHTRFEIMQQAPSPIRLAATPAQVSAMEATFDWLRWLEPEQRRLIWMRAEGLPWRLIGRRLNAPKTTIQRRWHRALEVVLAHLQADDSGRYARKRRVAA